MATRHRFQVDGEVHTVAVDEAGGRVAVSIDGGEPVTLDVTAAGRPGLLSMMQDGVPVNAYVVREGRTFRVIVGGRTFILGRGTGGRQRGAPGGRTDPPGQVSAPLAGVVVEIRISVGGRMEAREVVMVIEAMKMQNEVQAPLGGTVTAIRCEVGQRVDRGDLVLEYTPDEG